MIDSGAGGRYPSDLRFAAGREIRPPFAGDNLLHFYTEAHAKVGHVGISTGLGWNRIHCSRTLGGVHRG